MESSDLINFDYTCIDKIYNSSGVITDYLLKDLHTGKSVILSSKAVKFHLHNSSLKFNNLRLSAKDRVIVVNKCNKCYGITFGVYGVIVVNGVSKKVYLTNRGTISVSSTKIARFKYESEHGIEKVELKLNEMEHFDNITDVGVIYFKELNDIEISIIRGLKDKLTEYRYLKLVKYVKTSNKLSDFVLDIRLETLRDKNKQYITIKYDFDMCVLNMRVSTNDRVLNSAVAHTSNTCADTVLLSIYNYIFITYNDKV